MSPEERRSLRERLGWLRMERAVDGDQIVTLRAIRDEANSALREVGERCRAGDQLIRAYEARLRPDATKARDASLRNGTGRTEPAFPAVNTPSCAG